MKHSKEFDYNS